MSKGIEYRSDIDGLRAVGVLSVVFFHAFPSVIQGGYIGVDIFFVISGFLISSILLKDIHQQKPLIRNFYSRRIKRIFPALMIMLLTTLCAGWMLLLSDEFKMLGQHTAAATAFISNFWLWREAGYFDTASELKPLLHLWSLAIEEQFYIIWPLLLLFFSRTTRNVGVCILFTAFLSFLSCLIHARDQVTMFYFPQNRVWELMIGAFLANISVSAVFLEPDTSKNKLTTLYAGNIMSFTGMALLTIALISFNNHILYPSWRALLPTVGTALLIAAGETSWLNRKILATRFMVLIGLISYPLYLWHWPLLAFARIVEGTEPSPMIRWICIIISLLLAWLTYRVIEIPIRSGGKHITIAILSFAIVIGVAGYLCGQTIIKPRSNHYGIEKIMHGFNDWGYPRTHMVNYFYNGLAFDSQGQNQQTTIFLGDSNMEQYFPRINMVIADHPEKYRSVIFATKGGCIPIPNVVHGNEDKECREIVDNAYRLALENKNIDTVVIAAEWYSHFVVENSVLFFSSGETLLPISGAKSVGSHMALAELDHKIKELQQAHKRVFLILNIPVGNKLDPRGLISRSWSNFGFTITSPHDGIDRRKFVASTEPVMAQLRSIANNNHITVFDPVEIICTENKCPALTTDGYPLYKDADHLNATYVKNNLSFLDETIALP